jgi:hypothetical protein
MMAIQEDDFRLGLGKESGLRSLKEIVRALMLELERLEDADRNADSQPQILEHVDSNDDSQPQMSKPQTTVIIKINGTQDDSEWLHDILLNLGNAETKISELKQVRKLLSSLYFETINTRRTAIPKAHAKTFTWVLEDSLPNSSKAVRFVEWLRTETEFPFWIRGKAGAGKSTLMKFLSHHKEVLTNLRVWADKGDLITAGFYFWNSGTPLQKSLVGLLRSLLFEILKQCPELVSCIRKARLGFRNWAIEDPSNEPEDNEESFFDETSTAHGNWDREELLFTIKKVLKQKASTKFCFFIDGLDEYKVEGRQNHRELLETILAIAASPTVKVCISSRPWAEIGDVFTILFGKDDTWVLQLEDLTREDIRKYVTDAFEDNDHYKTLIQFDSGYSGLVGQIVDRAQGVFLWVFLVVQELLQGLTYYPTPGTLQGQLNDFPEDLDKYFQRMIDMVPTFDRDKCAQTFRIAMSRDEPLFMLTYAFVDELAENLSLQRDDHDARLTLAPAVIDRLHETMTRRLDGRCRGLIEVVAYHDGPSDIAKYRVDFMHRTVRDYILHSQTGKTLVSKESEDDCRLSITVCRATSLCLTHSRNSSLRLPQKIPMPPWLRDVWDELFHFAFKAVKDERNAAAITQILDDAEISGVMSAQPFLDTNETLLVTACNYGLIHYVRQKMSLFSEGTEHQVASMLLREALRPNKVTGELSPELVDYLLSLGANPNKPLTMETSSWWAKEDRDDKGLEGEVADDWEDIEDEDEEDEHVEDEDVKDEDEALNSKETTTFTWFLNCIANGRVTSKTEGVVLVLKLLLRNGANLRTDVVPKPEKIIYRYFPAQAEYLLGIAAKNSSCGVSEPTNAMPHKNTTGQGKQKRHTTAERAPRRTKRAWKRCAQCSVLG